MNNTAKFLDALAISSGTLADDRSAILSFAASRKIPALDRFDFESALKAFGDWLFDVVRLDCPSRGTRAINFSLFEGDGSVGLCVYGRKKYDSRDQDWACSADWEPKENKVSFPWMDVVWQGAAESDVEGWVLIQAIVIVLIRNFFAAFGTEFQRLVGLRRLHVTSGFCDGDLYEIRTPLT